VLVSVRLEIVLFLTQDTCTVCAECTAGSKIALDTLEEHLGDLGHVECHFGLFGESLTIGAI
jgi:NADH:ubiquinone oxidoreductase subunit F (NADH-binding)